MQGASAIAGIAQRTVAAWLLCGLCLGAHARDPHESARRALIAELRAEAAGSDGFTRIDREVLAVLERVPRHAYVPASEQRNAYENRPLAIGYGQTISQPYIVALMTSLAQPRAGQKILEVGTGSGYQAALLSHLVAKVYSIEIVEPLAMQASARLRQLGHRNVEVRHGDGYLGWPDRAPFDGIIVTAGARHVPRPLLGQLKPGGRMVIPVGSSQADQQLRLISKDQKGRVTQRTITDVRFVPLTRKVRR